MKFILGLIFGIIMVVFIFQNLDIVEINFLFWSISVSRALMIFLILLIGILLGAILRGIKRIKEKRETNPPEEG